MQYTRPLLALTLATLFVAQSAGAAAIRLDSGDWDLIFSGNSTTTSNVVFSIAFPMTFEGVTGTDVNVNSAGSLRLFDATSADFADLEPFNEADQVLGGNTTSFMLEETNAAFSVAGVDAGFRATWTAFDAAGALINQFQVSLFDLAGGMYAVEFNYELLTFGDDDTDIGYSSTSTGTRFDLLAEIGVPIADALGIGDFDPSFPDLCPGTPDALACNNFFDGAFGPSELILPDIAGGYFRSVSGADSTPVQGRYLFIVGDRVDVSEPPMLALLGVTVLAFAAARRRRRG